jgi:hypothetical protein
MKNNKLLSTMVYVYIIILTFIVLYYMYSHNQNKDYFNDIENDYNSIVSPTNINTINNYIAQHSQALETNISVNDANKTQINNLMENSVAKLTSMIDNYILSI